MQASACRDRGAFEAKRVRSAPPSIPKNHAEAGLDDPGSTATRRYNPRLGMSLDIVLPRDHHHPTVQTTHGGDPVPAGA